MWFADDIGALAAVDGHVALDEFRMDMLASVVW